MLVSAHKYTALWKVLDKSLLEAWISLTVRQSRAVLAVQLIAYNLVNCLASLGILERTFRILRQLLDLQVLLLL